MKLLLVILAEGNQLEGQTLNTVTAVKQLADSFDVVVFGSQDEKPLQACSIPGANTVIVLRNPAFEHLLAEPVTEALIPVIEDYDCVVFSSNTTSKNIMPRLAARCGISPISDVCTILPDGVFQRPIYAGNIIESVRSTHPKLMLSIRAASFTKSALLETHQASLDVRNVEVDWEKTEYIRSQISHSDRPELTDAKVVVSGGRGLGSEESFQLIYDLADVLHAAVGASRAAVDAGFVSNDYQVGQTGKIIAPDVYIAVGISGAIQHLAGMKDSRIVIAINKDPEAAIFQYADYGLVADLFDVLPKMTAHFKN